MKKSAASLAGSALARRRARVLGKKGRSESAKKAALARWKKERSVEPNEIQQT